MPVIAIVGPTATGKTALAVALAQELNGEAVSADSRQVYRGLDIGTAKPTPQEQGGVRHHMLDVASPEEAYSAARFRQEAGAALADIQARGRQAIVVGGTGFYLRALLEGGFIPDAPPDPAFRATLAACDDQTLHAQLAAQDPRRAAQIHPHNRVRVLRALEIIRQTGEPTPDPERAAAPDALPVCWLGLSWTDRDAHRALIDARIDAMLADGWLDEAAGLLARFGPDAHALTATHGYPELIRVAQGQMPLAEAVASMQIQIHQYARRQRTWFSRNPYIHWIMRDGLSPDAVVASAKNALSAAGAV